MKIQDLLFFLVLLILLWFHKPKWLVIAGMICLILSIPLFAAWIFFTAQRLVYYAAAFFLVSIVFYVISSRNE